MRLILLLTMLPLACAVVPDESKCKIDSLEADFVAADWSGPGVDDSGNLKVGSYVVAATYISLSLDDQKQKTFRSLMAGINGVLGSQPGLVGWRVGSSDSCVAGRTISVWQDEASMYKFVATTAHAAAMSQASTITRTKTATTHWNGDEKSASFEAALPYLQKKIQK